MEEKYKEFLKYDFDKSKEWQFHLMNLYPQPSPSSIPKLKRKFYKKNIDSDFDVNYTSSEAELKKDELSEFEKKYTGESCEKSSENTSTTQKNDSKSCEHSHSHGGTTTTGPGYEHHKHVPPNIRSHTHYHPCQFDEEFYSTPPQHSVLSMIINSGACFVWIAFLFSSAQEIKTLNVPTIGLIAELLIKRGLRFSKDYLLEIYRDNSFQDIILIFIFNLFSYESQVVYLCMVLVGIVSVSTYFRNHLRVLVFLKKYFTWLSDFLRKYLLMIKALLEIGMAFYLFSTGYTLTNAILAVVYLQFMEYKFNSNRNVHNVLTKVSNVIDWFDSIKGLNMIILPLKLARNFLVYKAKNLKID